MHLSFLLVTLTAATITSAAPGLQTCKTDERLTQWANTVCGQGQKHVYEDKGKTVAAGIGCHDIDSQTNSFDFALGPAKEVVAFTGSTCTDRVGVIYDTPGHAIVGNGDCVDANLYLGIMDPKNVGKRIASVKFE